MPTTNADNRPYLRREAYAFPWDELTEHQKSAMKRIAGFLLSALRDTEPGQKAGTRSDPRNRLAFIDGDRGMGKSSVLFSVLDLIENGMNTANVPTEISELFHHRRRFVPLDILDMEPLPRTANLLAAFLVRITSRLEYPGISPNAPRLALAMGDLDTRERLASELEQLELDAVLAWEGTARLRGSNTDSAAYAAEVLASEKAGLRINQRLQSALDGLAKIYSDADPIFVLPVDDFDLAPTRCLELLRIVRMITTPRLFFLIAGNTRIADSVLRLQSEGELADLAREAMAGVESPLVRAAALEIAANNLRKLIPPYQRARLEIVGVKEALRFRAGPDAPTLDEELKDIFFERNNATPEQARTSLRTFLFPHEIVQYSAANWLTGTPRQVLDRVATFERHRGNLPDWGEPLLRDLTADYSRELMEFGHIDVDRRDAILELLQMDDAVRLKFRRVFALDPESDVGLLRTFVEDHYTIHMRVPRRCTWLIPRKGRDPESPREAREVPKRLSAGLTALHDLAISLWGGYVFPSSIVYQPFWEQDRFPQPNALLSPVIVDWSAGGGSQETRFERQPRWYLPEWWTLREFERFAAHFESHAYKASYVDDYVRAWLAAVLEVLMDEPHEQSADGTSVERIRELLLHLAEEQPERFARKYLQASAEVTCALILAPESGCSAILAKELLQGECFLDRVGPAISERILKHRARTFSIAQRVEVLGEADVRLLAAISPEVASEIPLERLWRELEGSPKSYYPANRPPLTDTTPDLIAKAKKRPSKTTLTALKQALAPEYADVVRTIDLTLSAMSSPYESHPFNQFGSGALVPKKDAIAQVNVQQQVAGQP